jgi:hypothetical protein
LSDRQIIRKNLADSLSGHFEPASSARNTTGNIFRVRSG